MAERRGVRGRAARLTAGLVAAAASGCLPVPVPPVVPVPLPEGRTAEEELAALAREPVTARLARYRDGEVEVVEPGSVPPWRVHVIVHGWAPGWIGERDEPAWEAERDGRPFEPWMQALAEAFTDRDPGAVVLFYSWLDHAATSGHLFAQRHAFAYTDAHGERLAQALDAALQPGPAQVHLIGHSFGSRVAAVAATRTREPPRHLTILDAPDAELVSLTRTRVRLAQVLRELPLGTGPGQTFVDNYVSMLGVDYRFEPGLAAVVDVQTSPPHGALAYRARHLYPTRFYRQTVREAFGAGWSPLLAGSPPRGSFRQPFGAIALERR